jgi:hypothetical protein
MKRTGWLALLAVLAGCSSNEPLPKVEIPDFCEQQVYADPAVRDEIMKGAGSDYYRNTHEADLVYAKLDAVNRCLRQKGLLPTGGGVERPRRPTQ